jgi:cytochrome d ubiquinol oxidase subunit I
VIAGWITTEVGRQPYTVYGYLLTAQSHSPLRAAAVATSLLTFVIVYFIVFGAGTYYLLRLMAKAPAPHESEPASTPQRATGFTPAPALSKE